MTPRKDSSPFELHNRKEIVFILDDLAKHHTAINLDTNEGVGLVTSVLEVGADGNHIYLDISPDERINEKIKNSNQFAFTTQTGIKVRWHATHLQLVSLSDGDAFSMAIPASIERIQRREYFRMNSQMGSRAMICKIPFGSGFIDAVIADISVGGIGISIKGTPHEIFTEGEVLEGCSIDFPSIGSIPFRFKICGIWTSSQTKSGEQMHHIGFEFVDLSRGTETVVQRHMIQLERERISLK